MLASSIVVFATDQCCCRFVRLLSLRSPFFFCGRCAFPTNASELLKKKLTSRTISSSLLKKKLTSRTISSSLLKKKLVCRIDTSLLLLKSSTSKNLVPGLAQISCWWSNNNERKKRKKRKERERKEEERKERERGKDFKNKNQ